MERATVASLTAPRLQGEEFEIPGVGTVLIRALSRHEMLTASKAAEGGGALAMEREMISYALLEPTMTIDQVAEWQRASPAAEMMPLVHKINALSGIGKGAEKSDLSGV